MSLSGGKSGWDPQNPKIQKLKNMTVGPDTDGRVRPLVSWLHSSRVDMGRVT